MLLARSLVSPIATDPPFYADGGQSYLAYRTGNEQPVDRIPAVERIAVRQSYPTVPTMVTIERGAMLILSVGVEAFLSERVREVV